MLSLSNLILAHPQTPRFSYKCFFCVPSLFVRSSFYLRNVCDFFCLRVNWKKHETSQKPRLLEGRYVKAKHMPVVGNTKFCLV